MSRPPAAREVLRAAVWGVLVLALAGCERQPAAGSFAQEPLALGSMPLQVDTAETALGTRGGFRLTGVARYRITARIAGAERYRFDDQAKLAPVDLALAWGLAADPAVLARLDISQGHRWFHWHTRDTTWPLPKPVLEANMANVHIIPASAAVFDFVTSLMRGEVVALEGLLVDVSTLDGNSGVRTSRSRTDTGSGACEVFYVTGARRVPSS